MLDRLVLGVEALSADEGTSCAHMGEALLNAEMVNHAQHVTVVAESDKLGKVALTRICGNDQIDELITDENAEQGQVAALEAAGVNVVIV